MDSTIPYIPEPTLRRLPWYLACVSRLRAHGVERVSSTTISRELNVDSSQIAKDLSYLNIRGKTRIGYDVVELEQVLVDFLGFARSHNAVIMGAGSLGAALIADSGLRRFGLNIVAGFDVNPALVGTDIGEVPIFHTDELAARRSELGAEIAIIAVPVDIAADVAEKCVAAGFKALWNFTPFRIRTSPEIVVTNTSIYAHLAVMYNRLSAKR
ncbi:MAG: redox-sensing transcriptional repressor Rex [Bacteroides sp.]|nr:redox-sensing transcriptional repressor Rex [Bacteroidales bacterium]MBD5251322.1 redox-sensing transcriptional repressor Rex [Barnesiella sp.]MBD5367991.1 redox-sensing transcriptional repressor Rex [Bacteroides sp.]MDE5829000.1 redox-sensing transcriptional repressor Rex [Duncaniella sp.]